MSQRGVQRSKTFGVQPTSKPPDISNAPLSRTPLAEPEQTDCSPGAPASAPRAENNRSIVAVDHFNAMQVLRANAQNKRRLA